MLPHAQRIIILVMLNTLRRAHADELNGDVDQQLHLESVGGFEPMLYYTLIFLALAIISGILGFWVVASTAAAIAKVLFVIFLVLFVVSLITGRRPV